MRRLIAMVMKVIETKTRSLLTRIYTTYIRLTLEYATSCDMGFTSEVAVSRYKECKESILKAIKKTEKNKSYHERHQILQLQSLEGKRPLNDAVTIYKALHHIFSKSLKYVRIKVSLNVTLGKQFLSKKTKKKYCFQAFFLSGINTWNFLPIAMMMAPTISSLKSKFAYFIYIMWDFC